jgi:protein O-mannosyl-transferase
MNRPPANSSDFAPAPSSANSSAAAGVSDRAWAALLFAAAAALYLKSLGSDFVVDDGILLAHNPWTQSFAYLQRAFTQDFWGFQGARGSTGLYRPLVMVTLFLERQAFGLNPLGYHLVNTLLNGAVVLLVFAVGRRLWPTGTGPVWAAGLFAVLPVHVENVSPVSGISDLQCAFWMLLGLYFHLPGPSRQGWPRALLDVATAVCLAAAALSKEIGFLLLPVLVFCDPAGRRARDRQGGGLIRRYLLLAAATAGCFLLRWQAVGSAASPRNMAGISLPLQTRAGLQLLGMYILKLVWPVHLTYFLNLPRTGWEMAACVMLGGVSLLLVAAGIGKSWQRDRALALAIFWFALTIAPVLLVRLIVGSPYGERYLYIPSAGFCWVAGLSISRALPRERARAPVTAFFLTLLALMAWRSIVRLGDWKNTMTLATATLREDPFAGPFHADLGNSLMVKQREVAATIQYVQAIAFSPRLVEPYLALAGIMMNQGATRSAEDLFERAAQANPLYAETFYSWGVVEMRAGERERARELFQHARQLNPAFPSVYAALGLLAMQDELWDTARSYLEQARRMDPSLTEARRNLAKVQAARHDWSGAEQEYRALLAEKPGDLECTLGLADALDHQGRFAEEVEIFRPLRQGSGMRALALFEMGQAELRAGKPAEGIRDLEEAVRLDPGSYQAHRQLAMAYAAAGRHAAAVKEQQAAERLNPQKPRDGAAGKNSGQDKSTK